MPAELLAAGVVINIAAMLFMQQTARRHELQRVRHQRERSDRGLAADLVRREGPAAPGRS
jgi:hypothetical protein